MSKFSQPYRVYSHYQEIKLGAQVSSAIGSECDEDGDDRKTDKRYMRKYSAALYPNGLIIFVRQVNCVAGERSDNGIRHAQTINQNPAHA